MKIKDYFEGIKVANRSIIGKAITLIESDLEKDKRAAEKLIEKCIPLGGKSIRIGISGTPGVGKSTFIEALGKQLIQKNNKIAVLAIDPSSNLSKGSILGDKTRMTILSKSNLAFIRPSPNSGTLGGVSKNTRDTIMICEAAGFNIIFIETVGVGQAETLVESMTDFFIYLTLVQNGDHLQFIKKGVFELSDLIIINKADQNKKHSKEVKSIIENNVQYSNYKKEKSVFICSSLTGLNIEKIWNYIKKLNEKKNKNGEIKHNRKNQDLFWFKKNLQDELWLLISKSSKFKKTIIDFKKSPAKNTRKEAFKIIKKKFKEGF